MATTVQCTGMTVTAQSLPEFDTALANIQAAPGTTNITSDSNTLTITFDYNHTD